MAIREVVQFSGAPDIYARKFPNREFGIWAQLIVNELQEAILVKSAQNSVSGPKRECEFCGTPL